MRRDALDYVAHSSATSLATGRTQTVGVVMPPVDRWFFAELLAGIQESLFALDYDLVALRGAGGLVDQGRLFERVLPRRRFDGIIAVGIQPSARELERLQRIGRPLVSVGPYSEGSSAVSIDDVAAARIATEHLIELGHTDIAFVGGQVDPDDLSFGDAQRVEGYLEALDRRRTRGDRADRGRRPDHARRVRRRRRAARRPPRPSDRDRRRVRRGGDRSR